jgi:DNA recombination protein RmuC
MDPTFFLLFAILFATATGLAIGSTVTWLLVRSRIATAIEQGRSERAIDLATANERVRALESEHLRLQTTYTTLQDQATTWRHDLDQAREDQAMLTERTRRIPDLESRLLEAEASQQTAQQQAAERREVASRLAAELKAEQETSAQLRSDWHQEKNLREQVEAQLGKRQTEVAELTLRLDAERAHAAEKLALLHAAREELSLQFKALANDILEEKARRFSEQNQTNISQILAPLREKITEFKTRVEEIHGKDTEQQATLRAELVQLRDLNRQMTEEAHGLATALKGQVKKQGNWGELILENVLERSGLRNGEDFRREVSFSTEEGRKRPDVVVYLPQDKHLIIDAKVSLNAYTRYVNAENDLERQQALREHINAVGSRIEELSSRQYFELPGLNTPEMVFMFIPIESAFVEALRGDETLFLKAIEQNVLVATPTTLLTSLNIVRQLWRFEKQNAHTAELAEKAGKVYHKLVTFLGSMETAGKQLDRSREAFSKAMDQLILGKGNLIQQVKDFERLGVSVRATLPEHLVTKAALELEYMPTASEALRMEMPQSPTENR